MVSEVCERPGFSSTENPLPGTGMVSQRAEFLRHTLRHIALLVGAMVLVGLVVFGGVLGASGIVGL